MNSGVADPANDLAALRARGMKGQTVDSKKFAKLVGVASMSGLACGGGMIDPPPPSAGTLFSIEVAATADLMKSTGDVSQLTATGKDASGLDVEADFEWTSSDEGVVELVTNASSSSRVTGRAVENGTAEIRVASGSVSATVNITVAREIATVSVTPNDGVVEFAGDTAAFAAAFADARDNPITGATVQWSSSDDGVATVDANGFVTATGFGRAVVTATVGQASRDVVFEVVGDQFFLSNGTKLRYDIDLPDSSGGPFPAVVWIHGSGMLNRNTQRIGTDPLVPRGLAAFRYDKRGVGASGGNFFNPGDSASMAILAKDAAAAVRFLANFPQIDQARIGVFGNSQGGWIAPLAAAFESQISFMMMWSGTTVSLGLEAFYSSLAEGTQTPLDIVYPQLSNFAGRDFFDPGFVLANIDIPGFWILGGMDRSIPSRLDTLNLRNLEAQGHDYEFKWFPTARHDLRDNDTQMGPFLPVWDEYEAWLQRKGIL